MELDWEFVVNSAHVSVHLVPLCVNLVGYGAMLGTYIKLIHNRPIDSGLSEAQIKIQIMNKNRNLFLFAFFGAPLTLGLIKASSSSLKDIVTIKFPLSSELQLDNNNSISNNSLFMLISNLTKKIPNCLKLFFRLLLLSILLPIGPPHKFCYPIWFQELVSKIRQACYTVPTPCLSICIPRDDMRLDQRCLDHTFHHHLTMTPFFYMHD